VLSRHIATLEAEMGCKLLNRTTRSVSLTPAGDLVYQSFQSILNEYEQLKEKVTILAQGKTETLRIAVADYCMEDFAEPYAEMFEHKHPSVNVDIITSQPEETFQLIRDDKVDIAIGSFFPASEEHYHKVTFARDQLSVIFHKDHPFADYDHILPENLQGETFITFGSESSFYTLGNTFIQELLAKHSVFPSTFRFVNNPNMLGLEVQRFNGVCILPYSLRHMGRSYLCARPLVGEDCYVDMNLLYRKDNENVLISAFVHSAKSFFIK